MKVVILAGGYGTRISEESYLKPKPMIEIGNKPILWHIMKLYSYYGFNEFVICLGYKGYVIKEYFANYFLHQSDVTIDLSNNEVEVHNNFSEPWKVTLVDTGIDTMTGGRINKIKKYVNNKPFMLTYGDGLSNINIKELLKFHKKSEVFATLTAVQPEGRFGILELNKNKVNKFYEKPKGDKSWINGGFFVFEPEIFNYLKMKNSVLEQEPMENLAKDNKLAAYKHKGFWHAMDTLRDKKKLEKMWKLKNALWKIW